MQADTLEPILPVEVSDRAAAVLDLAHEKEWKLATAESCTGGLLAALLTDVRGRGHVSVGAPQGALGHFQRYLAADALARIDVAMIQAKQVALGIQ